MTSNRRAPWQRLALLLGLLIIASSLSGCTMARAIFDDFGDFEDFGEEPSIERVWDPLEPYNRVMFHFNDAVYVYALDPAGRVWRFIIPKPARIGIANAFDNVATPVRLVNDLLQLAPGKAGTELGRFVINSTIGVLGLWDAADDLFDIKAPPAEDLGQTLGYWGVGPGPPFVLPFLGPSNIRDTVGYVGDLFLHPGTYFLTRPVQLGVTTGETINKTSLRIGEYESLKGDALDPYTLLRDAYQQNREREIER